MAEELQNLLDRIQKDGVEKAEAQAAQIVARAKKDAESIVADAEQKAKQSAQKAEADAKTFSERAEKTLQQAARDVVLTVGEAVMKTIKDIVNQSVDEAVRIDVLRDILGRVVTAYFGAKVARQQIEILVSPEDCQQIADFFTSRYRAAIEKGLEIKSDSQIVSGFKVSMKDGNLYHDFSKEAIADALCAILQPRLAEIVRKAVDSKSPNHNDKA